MKLIQQLKDAGQDLAAPSVARRAKDGPPRAPIAEGERKKIPTDLIENHPHNREVNPKSCIGLAESMLEFGQIQDAVVRPHPTKKGHYQLGAGGRRFTAAKINRQPLGCIVRPMSDAEIEGMLVIENNQRENPDPRHEATQMRRFIQANPTATPQQIAALLGREEPWVKRRLRLLDLIEPVHEAWTNPEHAAHKLPIASMELIAQLTPDQQAEWLAEGVSNWEGRTHEEVVEYIESLSCQLDKADWLENPATFIPGCGPGCATSSAATDLFSHTEFADSRESKCAQCLNTTCFNKRQALARAAAWQTVIAKAPVGYYAITDKYSNPEVTFADDSTLKPKQKHEFHGWSNCKKSDPAAKPFIEEKDGTVKLTWKTPPEDAKTLPLPAGETAIKSPEDSLQTSIDRLQGKRYTLLLDELRDHVEKVPLPAFKEPAITVLCLASAFGTISHLSTVDGHFWDLDNDDDTSPQDATVIDLNEDDDTDTERSESSVARRAKDGRTPWVNFRDLNPTWHIQHLWKSIRKVLSSRLRDRTYTDKKCTLIKPEFITEMKEIATLTAFDFNAAYLRAANATKLPASLKDLDPVTLVKK